MHLALECNGNLYPAEPLAAYKPNWTLLRPSPSILKICSGSYFTVLSVTSISIHFCILYVKWAVRDSNPRPSRCKRDALTATLTAQESIITILTTPFFDKISGKEVREYIENQLVFFHSRLTIRTLK